MTIGKRSELQCPGFLKSGVELRSPSSIPPLSPPPLSAPAGAERGAWIWLLRANQRMARIARQHGKTPRREPAFVGVQLLVGAEPLASALSAAGECESTSRPSTMSRPDRAAVSRAGHWPSGGPTTAGSRLGAPAQCATSRRCSVVGAGSQIQAPSLCPGGGRERAGGESGGKPRTLSAARPVQTRLIDRQQMAKPSATSQSETNRPLSNRNCRSQRAASVLS